LLVITSRQAITTKVVVAIAVAADVATKAKKDEGVVSRPFGTPIGRGLQIPIGPASSHVWPCIYTLSRALFKFLKDLSYLNTT
jgi:hypothetical protein